MIINTPDARRLGHADHPSNPDCRVRASFARAATIAAFGRHAWALDHDDFRDRQPWQIPARAPEAGLAE